MFACYAYMLESLAENVHMPESRTEDGHMLTSHAERVVRNELCCYRSFFFVLIRPRTNDAKKI